MFAQLLTALSHTSQCKRAAEALNFQNSTAIATIFLRSVCFRLKDFMLGNSNGQAVFEVYSLQQLWSVN